MITTKKLIALMKIFKLPIPSEKENEPQCTV